ncbi:MAG: transposase, partial [Planctomycetia bacterium]|nr:transposase [Planctomycetia bacterium]
MATKRDNETASLLATITSLKKTIVLLKQMIAEQNKSRALLEQMIAEQQKINAEQQKTIDKLTAELHSMNNKFNLFFGKKTEKQKKNTSDELKTTQAVKASKKKEVNGGGGRTSWPESLPRVDTTLDPPEEERICQTCKTPFRLIGQIVTEVLHFKPMELYVERILRNKYVADCTCSDVRSITAESPIRPIDKGMVGSDIIALMAVMKYADHLPLSRQATQIFKRSGIEFSESSMCRWMRIIADLLEPLYQLIHALILNSFFVMIDASCAKYRSLIMSGRCKQGYIWGFLGDNDYPYTWYGFEPNGKRAGPAGILGNYSGYVQCDAQNIYDRIFMPEGV